MNSDVLDKVLSCQKLPTLPAVAARVLELTRDQNVSFRELAAVINSDVALTSKLLKTVNSSFYALRKPCGSINQAIIMLGLSAVKTLALGFSLVSSIAQVRADGFDLRAYWRRSLVSGIAAKCVAVEAHCGSDEEAFLGGLLQDVGMMALFVTLGDEYVSVVRQSQGDHHELSRLELRELATTHVDIGAQLASRWNLPDDLVMPIKYHERPTAAPKDQLRIVQAVALGAVVADFLGATEPGPVLKRLHTRGAQWLALRPCQCEAIIERTSDATRQIAGLLNVDPGVVPDARTLLAQASEQLRGITLPLDETDLTGKLVYNSDLDPTTGLPVRLAINRMVVASFEQARSSDKPVSFALIAMDEAMGVPEQMREDALARAAQLLRPHFLSAGAVLCRYDVYRFGVVMPGVDRVQAANLLETARHLVNGDPPPLDQPASNAIGPRFTYSAGLATFDAGTRSRIGDASAFVALTEQALLAAQRAGPGLLRVFIPRKAA